MHQLSTPEGRFATLVGEDASRPFVTYYDEASGERSELSRKSLANWVAKTRNLLGDELGLGVGDTAVVALPAHWIAVPVVLGCLAAGLTVRDSGSADVAFATPATLATTDALDRYVVDPDRAAFGFRDDVPGGGTDYVAAVRPQGDAWAGILLPATGDDPYTADETRAAAMTRAGARAAELGLADGGRLLVTAGDATDAETWLHTVLVPLAIGGSVVVVRNADAAVLDRRAEQERITARA
ncbi:TIGR03089 family protein [Jatrophihabitans endophyticus]|uniref:TIGR03089 family protein n=1 Tax=Jatrophihabitans endophyticus TaxID=1206085 RepID=A0A1M5RK59_9ACTN|nr:TIGR03089 family protein [Jatrophihabitans endophyticus]SHH26478.1 TIGR03089 family protein [Jatrophihabitans endophyticus]